jgi:hypothetical protein
VHDRPCRDHAGNGSNDPGHGSYNDQAMSSLGRLSLFLEPRESMLAVFVPY